MPAETISDAKLFFGGYDLSGSMNEVAAGYGAELEKTPVFGDTGMRRLAGIPDGAVQANGYWDPTLDGALHAKIGLTNEPFSVIPGGNAEGNRGFTFLAASGEYDHGGPVGKAFPFSVGASLSGGEAVIRATLMHRAVKTATFNGTGQQLGAISATQKLYGALHVFTADGTTPTLDVIVESDDNAGFTTAVTRMTFAQKIAIGSEWPTAISGAITDDYWRIVATLTGASPSFDFAVVLGIQ